MAASRARPPHLRLVRDPPLADARALAYTSLRGDTYYLHEGKTKTGKTRYLVAKQVGAGALTEMPTGFEFTESINGVVSVSKAKPKSVIPEGDVELVQAALARCSHLQFHKVREVKGEIVVFQADKMEGMHEMVSRLAIFPVRAERDLFDLMGPGDYSPVMKFCPTDKEYEVCRMTYRGKGGWSYPLATGSLASLARRFVPAIGTDAFYDLM
ncbi:MAG: hypothetical protein WCI05_08950 [Myxococcales bacterium]